MVLVDLILRKCHDRKWECCFIRQLKLKIQFPWIILSSTRMFVAFHHVKTCLMFNM